MDSLIRFFCFFFFLTAAFAGTPHKLITIYGIGNGRQVKADAVGNVRYQLQLGAFKDRQNAIKYKDQLTQKTLAAIEVVSPSSANGLYYVVSGLLPDALAVQTLSNELLAGKVAAHPQALADLNKSNRSPRSRSIAKETAKEASGQINTAPAMVTDHQPVNNSLTIKKAILGIQMAKENVSAGHSGNAQSESEARTQQIVKGLDKATTYDSEREWRAIEILNRESVANELKLKVSTRREEIIALQKRQLEINNELQKKVSMTIERIRQASL